MRKEKKYKYKVGDTVYIRRDLKPSEPYVNNVDPLPGVTEEMLDFRGSRAIITKIHEFYQLSCDKGCWSWSEDMLEDIREVRRKKLNKLYEKI